MAAEGYVTCPRCLGKGMLTEYGWTIDADGVKHYGDQTFKCPVCEGSGTVYDEKVWQLKREGKPLPVGFQVYDRVREDQKRKRR